MTAVEPTLAHPPSADNRHDDAEHLPAPDVPPVAETAMEDTGEFIGLAIGTILGTANFVLGVTESPRKAALTSLALAYGGMKIGKQAARQVINHIETPRTRHPGGGNSPAHRNRHQVSQANRSVAGLTNLPGGTQGDSPVYQCLWRYHLPGNAMHNTCGEYGWR